MLERQELLGPHEPLKMRRVAIIGAGAVGSFLGSMLLRAGNEVCFVARGNYRELCEVGLTLTRGSQRWQYPGVPIYASIAALPPVELVVVASKTPDIPVISLELAQWKETGTLLAVHNGLNPERHYRTLPSSWIALGGVAYMSAERLGPTEIRVDGDYRLVVGQVAPGDPQSARAAQDTVRLLDDTGLHASLCKDLRSERFRKLVWSLIFAGPCTLVDVDTRQLAGSREIRPLLEAIYREVQLIATAEDLPMGEVQLNDLLEAASVEAGHLVSMRSDRRHGRPIELDDIYGAARDLGAASGIRTPVLDAIYHLLAFSEPDRNASL